MRPLVMLLGLAFALLAAWILPSADSPGAASTGSTVYMPLLMKQGWMDQITIVQRDGHQAVYWTGPAPSSPYFPPATPTPTTPIVTVPVYLEVENHTDRNVTGITVEFRASDSAGAPITQTVGATLVDIVRPGQKSPVALNVAFPGSFSAFEAAAKSFAVSPGWTFTDWDSQKDLEVRWSPPWAPSPSNPVQISPGPAPPSVNGWVKNTGNTPLTGVTVVVSVRGNEQVSGLVLEAVKVPVYTTIYPGSFYSFSAYFTRDFGSLAAWIEAVAQRRPDIPGILALP